MEILDSLPPPPPEGEERKASTHCDPVGAYIRPPPPPHELSSFHTPDGSLFQTIHMGAAVVDPAKWLLVVDGMVARPFALTLAQLRALPQTTVTAFHECYGSPLAAPTTRSNRIGNVRWTGVALSALLEHARPLGGATHVWSEGLDKGVFATVSADRYQKDLPLAVARDPRRKVMLAHAVNGEALGRRRGGPVRLVVPGWFGTNSTKWVCRVRVAGSRAPGPFAARLYNEADPRFGDGRTRPVWQVEVNSVVVRPAPGERVVGPHVEVEGWAWSHDGVAAVAVCVQGWGDWVEAKVEDAVDFSWQKFTARVPVPGEGDVTILARATSMSGEQQPMTGRRNHVYAVGVHVCEPNPG